MNLNSLLTTIQFFQTGFLLRCGSLQAGYNSTSIVPHILSTYAHVSDLSFLNGRESCPK